MDSLRMAESELPLTSGSRGRGATIGGGEETGGVRGGGVSTRSREDNHESLAAAAEGVLTAGSFANLSWCVRRGRMEIRSAHQLEGIMYLQVPQITAINGPMFILVRWWVSRV